jgi:CubicO group peptidase (beta-lactamase class C family)
MRSSPLLVLVTIVLLSAISGRQTASASGVADQITTYLAAFAETGNFSGAVLVARGDKVLFRRAYGMANYELQVPNTPETRFHIASVSKPFTAAAILQLQEQGRLNVADHVSRYLPDFPNGDRITLDNLLTHTSGIPNVNNLPDYDLFARAPHSLPELIAKFANLPLNFQPGTNYRYSNSNYNLLALVVEKVSGETYGDYLRKHIFDAAGMRDSGHDGDALRLIPSAASGYEPYGTTDYEKAPYLDWSNKTGNGSLYSTLDDLHRFDRGLKTNALLQAATRQKYFTEGKGNRYGWFIRKSHGRTVMSSNGRSPGFTAELDRFPEDDVTIIVLSNSYATVSQDPIADGIAGILFGAQPPSPPMMHGAAIPQPTLASYAGSYQFGADYFVPNAKLLLTAETGFLLFDTNGFRTVLVPLSTTDFLERSLFGHVVFPTDTKGRPDSLIFKYSGKDFVAHRLKDK